MKNNLENATAYELARLLFDRWNATKNVEIPESLDDYCCEMLRQQAERIAELEKLVDELADYKMSYENCHRMCSGKGMN